jgi:hypothetical protein
VRHRRQDPQVRGPLVKLLNRRAPESSGALSFGQPADRHPDRSYSGSPDGTVREVTPQERIVQTFEWDGMVNSGMEQGLNESYAALDRLLAKLG